LNLQEAKQVPNSQDGVEEDLDMILQEGGVVWHEAYGEEVRFACITKVDFELCLLVDVKTDEELRCFPFNLKLFDSKPSSSPSGKDKSQEDTPLSQVLQFNSTSFILIAFSLN
jgi:hypothetical protein